MKRVLKSWVFWAFVAPPVLGAIAYGVLRETAFLTCPCGSVREAVVWRLGFPDGPSLPVFPGGAIESPSPLFAEILGSSHAHDWEPWYSNGESIRGPYGLACVLRAPPRNVAGIYRREASFRTWLKEKVERGEIAPAAVEKDLFTKGHYPRGQYPFGWTPPP